MRKIKTAIIGFGLAGRYIHLPPLLNHDNYEVTTLMTRNKDSIEYIRETYPKMHIVSDFQAVLEDDEIDLIVIATSNDVHEDYAKRALMFNKHVVCEKPFVKTYEQAKALFDLALLKNRILRVYHNRKFDGDIMTVDDLLKNEDFGKILSFSSRFDRYMPNVLENWREKTDVMPGVFYDLGPHLVHHMVRLFGKPKEVILDLFYDRNNLDADDHFEMTCYYDHLTCYLGADVFERYQKPRFEIVGTKKTFVKYGFDRPDLVHVKVDLKHQTADLRSVLIDQDLKIRDVPIQIGAHYRFYDLLSEHIYKMPEKDIDALEALDVILVMEKAIISSQLKKRIQL